LRREADEASQVTDTRTVSRAKSVTAVDRWVAARYWALWALSLVDTGGGEGRQVYAVERATFMLARDPPSRDVPLYIHSDMPNRASLPVSPR
jgi:hypothetical protein